MKKGFWPEHVAILGTRLAKHDDFSKFLHMSNRGSIDKNFFSISVNQRFLAIGSVDRLGPIVRVVENRKGYKMTDSEFQCDA